MALDPPRLRPEDLLGHRTFLESLVRRWIPDPEAARDVVQETWLRALESPPELRQGVRPWLRRVVLNLVRSRARRSAVERRQHGVEAESSAPPAPSAALETARDELRGLVAGEVLELSEPYRGVLLGVYFEGHSVAELARRFGRPENTVQSQLQRGELRLRRALERRLDARDLPFEGLLLALPGELERAAQTAARLGSDRAHHGAPRARRRPLALSSPTDWLAVSAVGAGLLALLPGGPLLSEGKDPVPLAEAVGDAATDRVDAAVRTAAATGAVGERRPLGSAPAAAAASAGSPAPGGPPPGGPPPGGLRVRLVDADDQPLAGVDLIVLRSLTDDEVTRDVVTQTAGRTDAAGVVDVELSERNALGIPYRSDGRWVGLIPDVPGGSLYDIVYVPQPGPEGAVQELRVAGRGFSLYGTVRDAAGRGLSASVQVGTPRGYVVDDHPDRVVARQAPRMLTEPDGTYSVPGLSRERHPVEVRAEGFAPHLTWVDPEGADRFELDVVLHRGNQLRGHVLSSGDDARGAQLEVSFLGDDLAETYQTQEGVADARGAFELSGLPDGRAWVWAQALDAPELGAGALVELEGGALRELTLELVPQDGFAVILWDEANEPLEGHVVFLCSEDHQWRRRLETGADGGALFYGAPPGELRAQVFQDWDAALTAAPHLVELRHLDPEAGEVLVTVERSREQEVAVRGRFLAADGSPLPETRLLCSFAEDDRWAEVALRRDGSVEFGLVPQAFRAALFVDGWGLVPLGLLHAEGAQGLQLGTRRLLQRGTVAFRGLPSEGTQALRYRIEVLGGWGVVVERGALDDLGQRELLPGSYAIELEDAAGSSRVRREFTVQSEAWSEVTLGG